MLIAHVIGCIVWSCPWSMRQTCLVSKGPFSVVWFHTFSPELISLGLLERGHRLLLFLVLILFAIISSYGHPSNTRVFWVMPLEVGLQQIFETLKWYNIVRIVLYPSKRYDEILTLTLLRTGLLQM